MTKNLIILMAITLLSGCNFHNGRNQAAHGPHEFPYVTPPAMVSSREEAVEYTVPRFWNRYIDSAFIWEGQFKDDSTVVGGVKREDMDKAVRDYVWLLWGTSQDAARSSLQNLMASLEAASESAGRDRIYSFLTSALENMLYDPNSDFRNEEMFIPVAESILRCRADSSNRHRYRFYMENCLKNRVGQKAADFSYTDSRGGIHTLYGTPGEYTILLFSNPGCPSCRETVSRLHSSEAISGLIGEGRLTLLSIYIDEDIGNWLDMLSEWPEEWETGYNHDLSIRDELVYDVRAIPSLYLLDRDKNIIFKDISTTMLLLMLQTKPL